MSHLLIVKVYKHLSTIFQQRSSNVKLKHQQHLQFNQQLQESDLNKKLIKCKLYLHLGLIKQFIMNNQNIICNKFDLFWTTSFSNILFSQAFDTTTILKMTLLKMTTHMSLNTIEIT
jgi:hypothetical protein